MAMGLEFAGGARSTGVVLGFFPVPIRFGGSSNTGDISRSFLFRFCSPLIFFGSVETYANNRQRVGHIPGEPGYPDSEEPGRFPVELHSTACLPCIQLGSPHRGYGI